MAGTPDFDTAYTALNAEQKMAVDAIEGPVFVIAGPGTGKTQVLTLRIANILRRTDTAPESILALTFTDAAAREMRTRLTRLIGARAATRVRLYTFHGFAEYLISRYPDEFPRIIGAHVATDAERAELLDTVLLSTPVKHLRPFGDPLFYHPSVARALAVLKRENISPDMLQTLLEETQASFETIEGKVHQKGKYIGNMKGEYVSQQKRIDRTEDLLMVYRAYEEALTGARRYDYEDLILEVVRALEAKEEFRLQVQESLLYVLADEHQDANRAQNALLELLSGFNERPNLFIVGDEKQAIYRFQGADLDTMHYFREKFEGTTILTLVENYRSPQTVLDQALALISASPDTRLSRTPLIAQKREVQKPLHLSICETPEQEIAQLAQSISECIAEGTSPADIAVLVRRNRDVAEVTRMLTQLGIGVSGSGDENALQDRFVLALIRILRMAADPSDDHIAGILTLPGFSLSIADIVRITQYARKERRSIVSVLEDRAAHADINVAYPEQIIVVAGFIQELVRLSSYERPAAVAERALQVSGLLPRILQSSERESALASMRGFLLSLEDISRREHEASLPRALQILDVYAARNISLSGKGNENLTKVHVMTVHRAKGREFAQVFLPRLSSRVWSTRARAEYFELPGILSGSAELEDERRLLYVAITRAKERVYLSYSQAGEDGRTQDPTELIEDLAPKLIETILPTVSSEQWLSSTPYTNGSPENAPAPSKDDLVTLRATFFAQGISSTALNNYIQCPWKYFYVNLLRLPEVENKFMLYGTAVHAALRTYAEKRSQGSDIGVEGLQRAFEYHIHRAPLSERERIEMEEKGTRALDAWWLERHIAWPQLTRAEVSVQALFPLIISDIADLTTEPLPLRGTLDRVDEVAGAVRVIDYKTGKPKSRNTLLGQTKDADGNYVRQLTFYKLLLARSEEPRLMQEGVIEFVEPDDAGTIRSEVFAITDEDVRELEERINILSKEVLTLSFWNTPCDDHDCPWCALRFSV